MKTIKFKINTETKLPRNFIDTIPSSGQADDAVKSLLQDYNVECPVEDAKKYLRSTGGWTDDELQDHEENLGRIIWIACLDCQEQETSWFYMGE